MEEAATCKHYPGLGPAGTSSSPMLVHSASFQEKCSRINHCSLMFPRSKGDMALFERGVLD